MISFSFYVYHIYVCVYIHINICICVCVCESFWMHGRSPFKGSHLFLHPFFPMRFRPKKPIPKYILDTAGTFAHRTTVLLWWRRSPAPAGSRSQRSCGSPSCGSAVVGVERRWSSCGTRLKGPYGARNWTVHIGHENLNHLIPEVILGAPRGWTVDVVSCLNVLELLDIGPCISWFLMYLSMWFLMLAHWNRHISTARSTSHGALDTTLRPSYWDLGGLQLALRFWALFLMFLNGTST